MARFEMTLSNGEKILVEHAVAGMRELRSELEGAAFVLFADVKGGPQAAPREIVVATRQIMLVRALGEHSTQSSDFKPKR